MPTRPVKLIFRKAPVYFDPGHSQQNKGRSNSNGMFRSDVVIIHAYNRSTNDIVVRIGRLFYHLKGFLQKGNVPAKILPSKKMRNAKCIDQEKELDDTIILPVSKIQECHDFDNEQMEIVLDALNESDGSTEVHKVYEEFLEATEENNKENWSCTYLVSKKAKKASHSFFCRVGKDYTTNNHDLITASAYASIDATVLASDIDTIAAGFVKGSSKHMSLQTVFRLTSVLSLITGILGFFYGCRLYAQGIIHKDKDVITLAKIQLVRSLLEFSFGLMQLVYRILLLIGHAAPKFVLQKIRNVIPVLGGLYIAFIAIPSTRSALHGNKIIKIVEKEHSFASIFALNKQQQESLRDKVYEEIGYEALHEGLSDKQIYEVIESLDSYMEKESASYLKLREDSDIYITKDDRKLIDTLVQKDLNVLRKGKSYIALDRLKDDLVRYYENEILRLKAKTDSHLSRDFGFSQKEVKALRQKTENNSLTQKELLETLDCMKSKRNLDLGLSLFLATMVVVMACSLFISGGTPLLVLTIAMLVTDVGMFLIDAYYLYASLKQSGKKLPFDTKAFIAIGLTTAVASVLAIVATKEVALQFVEAVLCLWLVGVQVTAYNNLLGDPKEGVIDIDDESRRTDEGCIAKELPAM